VKYTTGPIVVYVPLMAGVKLKVVDVTVVGSIVWLKVTTTCELTATLIAPLAGVVESTKGDCVINVIPLINWKSTKVINN